MVVLGIGSRSPRMAHDPVIVSAFPLELLEL